MKFFYLYLFFPIFLLGITLPKLKVETYTLPNGLKVILYEDPSNPIVTVNVNYQVGSKNESEGKTGYAHLFEHIMFQGSKNFNDDFFKALQNIGGEVNGATNQDRTRYYENVPSNYLERALWLEADRMGFLKPALTEERLKNQIDVVRNERRQNYDDAPYGIAYEEILKLLYPPEHPYSWPTIGFHRDLERANLKDMVEFFDKFYTPSNSSLCIGGDLNIEETRKLVEKYFGTIPPGKPAGFYKKWVPEFNSIKRKVLKDKVQLPRIYMVWHTVPIYEEFDAEMDLFARILGEGEGAPLYKRIVKERGLGNEVRVYHNSGELSGYFQIMVTLNEGVKIEEVEKEILRVIEETLKKPLDKEAFLSAQNMFTKEFLDSMKRIGGFYGICDRLNAYNHYLGEPNKFQWDLDRYLKTTEEKVQRVAKNYLSKPYGILIVEPIGNLKSEGEEPDRAKMPEGKGEISFSFNKLEKFQLSNGMEVFYYNYKKIPESLLLISFEAGSFYDFEGFDGLSNIFSQMLKKGTEEKDVEELEKSFKKLGGEVETYSTQDSLNLLLSIIDENFYQGLKIIKEIILKPSFPEKELEVIKKEIKGRLRRQKDSLPLMAQFGILKNLYGEHPYNHHFLGETKTIEKIDKKVVKEFYDKFINPDRGKIIYIGPKDINELKKELNQNFGDWKKEKSSFKIFEKPLKRNSLDLYIIDKPNSAQTYITLSTFAPSPTSEKYPAYYIANHIFGGYFLSRLNLKLREEKGFTYGARSSIYNLKYGSYWGFRVPVDLKFTKEALEEIFLEIEGFLKDKPITEKELEEAKNNLIYSLPSRLESPDNLISFLESISLFNLPLDYLNNFPENLRKVTLKETEEALKELLKDKKFLVLVVGDREKIYEKLKGFGWDKIVFCDNFGNYISFK